MRTENLKVCDPRAISEPVPTAADVDAAWLTTVLADAGVARGSEVVGVEAAPIGTGQVGENVRFILTWAAGAEDRPSSVVGKFPSTSDVSLAAAATTKTYVREVGFYRDVSDRVAVRTPRLYHLSENLAVNQFALIMEDIAPSEVGDQIIGCDLHQAGLAMDAAAALHGSTWSAGSELEALGWLEQPAPNRLAELYGAVFGDFVARYEHALSPDEIELGRWLGTRFEALSERAGTGPMCLVHGDFRLDNMLFGTGPAAPALTVVDWQTVRLGFGPNDVAYFLGAGLLPEARRRDERALVDRYGAGLAQYGVEMDAADLWEQYRLGSASGYVMAVIASQIVEQTTRGDEMFVAMASRHANQMVHLELVELIG